MSNPPASSPSEALVYENFELEIGQSKGKTYPVTVLKAPGGGDAHGTLVLPFEKQGLDDLLLKLQTAVLFSSGVVRRDSSQEGQVVQDFGRKLFEALMNDKVGECYSAACATVASRAEGLRLVLRITAPELAALPWEFLFDQDRGGYIGLSRDRPIVRYMETPQPIQPLTVRPPLHILGMITDPCGKARLDIDVEKQRMEDAVKNLKDRGLVTLTWIKGQTWRDLQEAMDGGPWHIFHFIGHGGFDQAANEGIIDLADEDNQRTFPLHASDLANLLADHHSLRLVLLNSCEGGRGSEKEIFSSMAAILVRRGIPAVLAMQFAITDKAAIEFSRTFYTFLARFNPLEAAVAQARKAVRMAVPLTDEWGIPVLYMRAAEGVIFTQDSLFDLEAERKQLADQYSQALSLFSKKQWQQVVDSMKRIRTIDPGYSDPNNLLARALDQLKPRFPPKWMVIAGILGAIILLAIFACNLIFGTIRANINPTSTPEGSVAAIVTPSPTSTLTSIPTTLPISIFTPIPTTTLTSIPTFTPSVTPTLRPLPPPGKFVLDYFNFIQQRDYVTAFSLLSDRFRLEAKVDVNRLQANWDRFQQINPTVTVIELDDLHAKVLVTLDLLSTSGDTSRTQIYYDMIPNPRRSNWLFDHGYY